MQASAADVSCETSVLFKKVILKQPGTAAFLLPLLLSSFNWLSC